MAPSPPVSLMLLALLTPLVFCPWSFDSFELPKLLVLRFLLFVALAQVSLDFYHRKTWLLPRSPIHLPVALLFCTAAAATLCSALPRLSVTGNYQSYAGLLRLADGLVLYLLAVTTLRDKRTRCRLYRHSLTAAGIMAVCGIVQYLGGDFRQWDLSPEAGTSALRYRSFATLASPSFLGLYLAMSLPLMLTSMSSAVNTRRLLGGAGLLLITVCLVLTFSRAAWLGAAIGGGGSMRLFSRKGRMAPVQDIFPWQRLAPSLPVIALGIFVGILLTTGRSHVSAVTRAASFLSPPKGSAEVRILLWRGAVQMALEKPLLGWGAGTFRYVFARFALPGMKQRERYNVSSHNFFLDSAIQNGLLGVCVFVWLIISVIRVCRQVDQMPNMRSEVGGVGGALAAYAVGVQFGFASLAVDSFFWLLLGCLAAMTPTSCPVRSPVAKHVAIGVTLTSALVTLWTLSWFVADVHFQSGETAYRRGENMTAMEEFGEATAWNPAIDLYWIRRGQSMEVLGLSSVEDFRAAILANPLNAANYAILARTLEAEGKPEAASDAWKAALARDPWWEKDVLVGP